MTSEPGTTALTWLRRRAGAATWAALAAVGLAGLIYVAACGLDLPRADEWSDAWVLVGREPFSWSWAWKAHNVHRAPLSRLLRLGLFHASGRDFRSAMVFMVLVLAAAAGFFLRALRRERGRASWVDPSLVVLLAGPGHFMNVLWSFQVAFVLSGALAVATVALLGGIRGAPDPRRLTAVGACLTLQVLTGANGVFFAAPLLPWLLVAVMRHEPNESAASQRWRHAARGTTAVAAMALEFYPVGLERTSAASPDALSMARTLFQFVSTGLGGTAGPWPLRLVFLALALGLTAWALLSAARQPAERWRATGLLSALGSCLLVAAAVGYGRGELGAEAGLQARYTTLAISFTAVAMMTATLPYGRPGLRQALAAGLAAVIAVLAVPNTVHAVVYGQTRREEAARLAADTRRGLPPAAIAARNAHAIHEYTPAVADIVRGLIAARAWPFADYQEDSRIDTTVVRQTEVLARVRPDGDLEPDGEGYRAVGPAPRLLVPLAAAVHLAAVELRVKFETPEARVGRLELRWAQAGGGAPDFSWRSHRAAYTIQSNDGPQTVLVPVYDAADVLLLNLDRAPARFTVEAVTLHELDPGWMEP